jgi:hypothetical protein
MVAEFIVLVEDFAWQIGKETEKPKKPKNNQMGIRRKRKILRDTMDPRISSLSRLINHGGNPK